MIHPTAVVHKGAQIGNDCEIGPLCVIGEHVTLGDRCQLHSHVVIDGHTTLGTENKIFPFASIGLKTQDLKWNGGLTRTSIGDRNVFRENVTVNSATGDGESTTIGSDNNLLAYAHVAHNVTLGNHIIISNVGTLAGHVIIDDHVIVAGLGGVHQFCRLGKHSMVGGCSKVVQDVAPYMIVDGNPARTRTVNKVGLERNGFTSDQLSEIRQAYKILFRSGLTTTSALERIQAELSSSPEIQHLIQFVQVSERGLA
jgi:UDP-N-acetylglucosamine acyltransferase